MTLAALLQQNQTLRRMAVVLSRSPGRLSRELKCSSSASAHASSTVQRACEAPRVAAGPARKLDAGFQAAKVSHPELEHEKLKEPMKGQALPKAQLTSAGHLTRVLRMRDKCRAQA